MEKWYAIFVFDGTTVPEKERGKSMAHVATSELLNVLERLDLKRLYLDHNHSLPLYSADIYKIKKTS